MTTGDSPEPADRAWTVLHRDALRAWLDGRPLLGDIGSVTEWIRACELLGPPSEALLVPDGELCSVIIPGTHVEVEFLVVAYERLIVIRSIRPA